MNVTTVTNDTGYVHHNLLIDTVLRTRLWSALSAGQAAGSAVLAIGVPTGSENLTQ